MFISPSTNIKILKGIPIDNTYEHTLYFDSRTAQTNYFLSKVSVSVPTDATYQRVKDGTMRVGIPIENLYNANYLMFNNVKFENKWFYAFITNLTYINNEVTEIEYEIDVMQTWLVGVDYALPNECYIVRQHVTDDTIGKNLQPESVSFGEQVFNNYAMERYTVSLLGTDWDAERYFMLQVQLNVTAPTLQVLINLLGGETYVFFNIIDGIPCASLFYAFPDNETGLTALDGVLYKLNTSGLGEAVQALYVVPDFLLDKSKILGTSGSFSSSDFMKYFLYTNADDVRRLTPLGVHAPLTNSDTLDGYNAHNNKLRTYPYNYYHVDDSVGHSLALRYEYFDNLQPSFNYYGHISQPPEIMIKPTNYKGQSESQTENLTVTGFAQGSVASDQFYTWLIHSWIPSVIGQGAGLLL